MFGGLGWSQKLSPLKTNLLNHWTNSILEIYRELWFIISHNMWYDKINLLVNIFCAVEFINFFWLALWLACSFYSASFYHCCITKGMDMFYFFFFLNVCSSTCVFSITLAVMISYWTVASHGREVLTSPLIIIHWPLLINHTDLWP